MPRIPEPLFEQGETVDGLHAEHGFSMLVTVAKGGREHRFLFDAGVSPDGVAENMRRLDIDPGCVVECSHLSGLCGAVV